MKRKKNSTILTVLHFKYEYESANKQQVKIDKISMVKVLSKAANRRKVNFL